jgi:tripartite-type tricarboxylate transporter receptor subunit TctC
VSRALLVLLCWTGVSFAQVPAKPIRIMVPYAAGGLPDVLARTVGQRVSELTGQPVIAENRPGAGGVVAAETVIRAQPDGSTLLVADSSIYSIGPVINRKLPFDPLRDLAPITLSSDAPIFLVVNAALPVHSLKELLALARSKPGLSYGSSGLGTAHHLAMELMRAMADIELTHVPYKGAAQSVPAVVAGDVAMAFGGLSSVLPHARSGRVRILAVNTAKRTSIHPDAPTVAEAGIPGYELGISIGFLAGAGTPRPIVEALSVEFNRAAATPEVRQRMVSLGLEPVGTTPEQFSDAIRNELRQYGELVKRAAFRID